MVSILGSMVSFVLLALAHNLALLFLARYHRWALGGQHLDGPGLHRGCDDRRGARPQLRADRRGLRYRLHLRAIAGWISGSLRIRRTGLGGGGPVVLAIVLTWIWLPEMPSARLAARWPSGKTRPACSAARRCGGCATDLAYWCAFALYQTTFALFVGRRFGFDVTATGLLLAVLGVVSVVVQLGVIGPTVRRFGERRTLAGGLARPAWVSGAALAPSVTLFLPAMVVAALGAGLSNPSLSSLLSQTVQTEEQGRLQGVSSALESLGRTVGPLWGNGVLGALGEGPAYGSAALILLALGLWTARLASQPAGAAGPRSS